MQAWARIEYRIEDQIFRTLWEGRFDISEHDVLYAAQAVLRANFPKDDGLDAADVTLRVYPSQLETDMTGKYLDYADAAIVFSGVLLMELPLLHEAKDNPYPLAFELLRKGKLTEFSSTDDLDLNTGNPRTYFWYSCPAVEHTTGGPAKDFTRYVRAMAKGWDGYDAGKIKTYLGEN